MGSSRKLPRTIATYEVLALLGEGGTACVYRARDPRGREVALKVVRDDDHDDAAAERFKREARLALALVHPNIVKTHDAGYVEGRVYIACELMAGGSLAGKLKRETRFDERMSLLYMRDVFRGLKAISEAGLVHRDVKPENVLLDAYGVAKLTDLGLARTTSLSRTRCTRTGIILGSPLYMSPEQIDGDKDLDVRTDIYSSGVMFYHCLTGRPPFMGKSVMAILKQHLNEVAPPVREAAPEVSEEVASLVASLLEKDRTRRPQEPRDVLARLDGLVHERVNLPRKTTAGAMMIPVLPPSSDPDAPDAERALSGPKDEAKALSRAALVVSTPAGIQTILVFSGDLLRFGRGQEEDDPHYACLRVSPEAGNELANQKISRRHFMITLTQGTASISDLGSVGGTFLEGTPLKAQALVHLASPLARVSVARMLDVTLRVVGAPATRPPAEQMGMTPALLVERPTNGSNQAYALVPARMGLAAGPHGFVAGGDDLEIFSSKGHLRLRGGRPSESQPLVPGLTFQVKDLEVRVCPVARGLASP